MVNPVFEMLGKKSENLKENNIIIYKSNFDYEKFEISDLKKELIKLEEKVSKNHMKTMEYMFYTAEALYDANKKMANKKNGTYVAWCTNLGITRNKSADLLNAYRVYLETDKKEALALPVRVIRELNKKKNNFSTDEILTVIESEKPSEKLEEIKNIMLHGATLKNDGIQNAEIVKNETKNIMLHDATLSKKDILEKKENLFKENEILNKEIENLNKKIQKKIELVKKNKDEINNLDENLTTKEKQLNKL